MNNNRMIKKPVILIVSAGRTGTKFFGNQMQNAIPGSISFHEPDVISFHEPRLLGTQLRELWFKFREFGIYQTTIGKLLDKTGMRALSAGILSGSLDKSEAARQIYKHRARFYERQEHSPVIEAYSGWFGLLPVLPDAMEQYRVIVIVRDPRTWLASAMSKKVLSAARDIPWLLGLARLNPKMIGDHEFVPLWPDMDDFERLCWTWSAYNQILIDASNADENIELFRFEDIFECEDKRGNMRHLLDFVTCFGHTVFPYDIDKIPFDNKINSTRQVKTRQEWQNWHKSRCIYLDQLCGKLMRQLGYGREQEWLEKIS